MGTVTCHQVNSLPYWPVINNSKLKHKMPFKTRKEWRIVRKVHHPRRLGFYIKTRDGTFFVERRPLVLTSNQVTLHSICHVTEVIYPHTAYFYINIRQRNYH